VTLHGLGGVRTDRFGQTVALYRDMLGLEPFHADETAGVELLTELERDRDAEWCHFRGPDGNVYEIVSGAGDAP
jgi:hypothetical protein